VMSNAAANGLAPIMPPMYGFLRGMG